MSTNPQNPIAGFIRKMNIEMFGRIVRGQFDAEADLRQLQKYLDMAHHIGSPVAAGNIYLTIFLLQISTGQFKEAIASMDKGADEFRQADDPSSQQRVTACQTNQAETYHLLGDYAQAITIYERVLAEIDQLPEDEDTYGDRYVLYGSMATSHLAQGNVEAAERLFKRIFNDPKRSHEQFTNAIMDANIGMSEIHLRRDEHAAAQSTARIALDIALRQHDERRQFFGYCALAHCAAHPDESRDPEPYYADGIAAIQPVLKSAYNVVALLEEARYHHRHGNSELAKRFVALAQPHFHAIDVHAFDDELVHLQGE